MTVGSCDPIDSAILNNSYAILKTIYLYVYPFPPPFVSSYIMGVYQIYFCIGYVYIQRYKRFDQIGRNILCEYIYVFPFQIHLSSF